MHNSIVVLVALAMVWFSFWLWEAVPFPAWTIAPFIVSVIVALGILVFNKVYWGN